ncbi:MAG: HAD family hydrolase [Oscillospiraceae bacterium]|nr:HAD family hydrolase [Oscillospiraceae bacterium]
MKARAVLFDLDGTLLDTLTDLTLSVNAALERFALPVRSRAEIRRFLGNGIRNLIRQSVPDGEADPRFEEIFETFRDRYNAHCLDCTQPYEGILPMLARLRAEGTAMAMVSNKVDTAVQALYQAHLRDVLDFALGQQAPLRIKPAPDMPMRALSLLGVQPEEAVLVGDSEVDLLTARNCDLPCILVTWGFRDREELAQLGADALCDTPEDLTNVLLERF